MPKPIQVVQVSFRGNIEKLYDFFTEWPVTPGNEVVVDTQNGLAVGKAVKIKPFSQRSKECSRWLVMQASEESMAVVRKVGADKVAVAEARELEEMLGL